MRNGRWVIDVVTPIITVVLAVISTLAIVALMVFADTSSAAVQDWLIILSIVGVPTSLMSFIYAVA